MIAYLEGRIIKKAMDRVVLLAGHVGYEILLPAYLAGSIEDVSVGEPASFFIYHYQTERQPKPVLIGFSNESDRDFFELFISVEAIGPIKGVKALTLPVSQVAAAIEAKDAAVLRRLKGIGQRTAAKIIAALSGKVERFAGKESYGAAVNEESDFIAPVLDVLVKQLGHSMAEARRMIRVALTRNPDINTPEDLFDEVYRGDELIHG